MRPDKVEEFIHLIADNKKARDVINTIHFSDIFPFTYDLKRSADVNSDYPDPKHDVDNFKLSATVVVEFPILLQNYKVSKKVDAVKEYLFYVLGKYHVDNPIHSTILTSKKRQCRKDKWMVTLPWTKKTITN